MTTPDSIDFHQKSWSWQKKSLAMEQLEIRTATGNMEDINPVAILDNNAMSTHNYPVSDLSDSNRFLDSTTVFSKVVSGGIIKYSWWKKTFRRQLRLTVHFNLITLITAVH